MAAKRKWTAEQLDQMLSLFDSDLTNKQVADMFGCDYHRSIKPLWLEAFGATALHDRYRRSCARSKLGKQNPMFGAKRELHPRHVKSYISKLGYRMVDVPDWWEGPTKASKYLEHVIVGCAKYGLTKPTKGFVFHHEDHDKLNNSPDNLTMMSIAEHMAHHKNATRKVQRLSREGVGSKKARSALRP